MICPGPQWGFRQELLLFSYLVSLLKNQVNEKGEWRIRYNKELYELYKSSNIITDIKIARLRWAGHVQRMKNDEMVKRKMEGKPEGRRGVGRPCSR